MCTSADLLLELVGGHHHLNVRINVKLDTAVSAQHLLHRGPRLLETTMTNEPPGGLGREEGNHNDRNRPDPLQGKRDTVPPLALNVHQPLEDTRRQQDADDPAHVDPRGHVVAQVGRADVGGVGDGECLEDAPGDTLDDTRGEEHGQTGGEEGDEDGADEEDHEDNHGFLVADPFGDEAVDDEADDGANLDGC